MSKVTEERIRLRMDYSRETELIFSDNIPLYADWLEEKLTSTQGENNLTKEQVLKAFDIIEKYKEQEKRKTIESGIIIDSRSILLLGLDVRGINALKNNNILTIGELLSLHRRELKKFRNLGKKTITNINEKIKEFGIETTPFKGGW